jgi:hypothetical protein
VRNPISIARLGALAFGVVACSTNPTSPASRTVVASVVPAGGSVAVPIGSSVMVTFSNPMQMGMEIYAALHEGSVTGPVVAGTWMWSGDRTQLTFTPTMPLKAGTDYTMHLGGGMVDGSDAPVDFQSCVNQFGGQWATPGMMGGGMMGGSTMMGPGWKGSNGMYGMTFTFTTA